jgi:hypothetical protein
MAFGCEMRHFMHAGIAISAGPRPICATHTTRYRPVCEVSGNVCRRLPGKHNFRSASCIFVGNVRIRRDARLTSGCKTSDKTKSCSSLKTFRQTTSSQFGSRSEIIRLEMLSSRVAFNTFRHALMTIERRRKISLRACCQSFCCHARVRLPSHMSLPNTSHQYAQKNPAYSANHKNFIRQSRSVPHLRSLRRLVRRQARLDRERALSQQRPITLIAESLTPASAALCAAPRCSECVEYSLGSSPS